MLTNDQRFLVTALIRQVGDECIHGYFRNLSEQDISYKDSAYDPVSVADKEAEKHLQEGLLAILPDSLFVGEESYACDKSILTYLKQSEKPVWVIDPIDGTLNFVSGREGFGILACLTINGEVVSSWFYEVCSRELTEFHKGESVQINGVDHNVTSDAVLPYKGQIGYSLYELPEFADIWQNFRGLEIEQAIDPSIINYSKMLKGELDFLVYRITYPWDHLAGIAAVRHLGGVAKRWSGEDFMLDDVAKGLVVARNETIHDLIFEQIISPLKSSEAVMSMTSNKRK